jgi:hypothetical protein
MKIFVTLAVIMVLSGCAATYKAPMSPNRTASADVPNSKVEILAAARRALVASGYQITAFDDASGIVSSAPRDLRVAAGVADCGTTMGIDYLKDPRTKTRVAFGVIASNGHMEVRANVEGEYKIGASDQDITLSCNSMGTLDQEMIQKIIAAL